MLNAIKSFVENQIFATSQQDEASAEHALRLASAALLIEIMRLDETEHEAEQRLIIQLLQQQFALDDASLQSLLSMAREELHQATDYFQFTSLIREHYDQPDRVRLVEQLWRVAAADGHIDKYEEHLVRRISELLYVSHSDFVRTRHRVEAEMVAR